MQLESLSPEQIQTAMDRAMRLTLEVTMFAKVYYTHGERPPDLGPEIATALQEAIRTLNAAVKRGYHPTDSIYTEVEKNMQDDKWRGTWLDRTRTESYNWSTATA
jgi:hypothetical protein